MMRASLLLVLVACTETRGPLEGTQSIHVEMIAPANPGTVDMPLQAMDPIVVNLRALNANGDVDATFSADLRVYAQFLGTVTPQLSATPLATIPMTNGVAMNQTIVPAAAVEFFGPTTLWIDNGVGVGPDYEFGAVTGTSPTIWYRDPYINDLQMPADEKAISALSLTPLTDKQIRVATSRHGDRGALVVTSVFAQGYTVADVQCVTGGEVPTPPCTAGPYDHIMVFTFSSPRDQHGRPIVEGEVIQAFNGGLSEFNGLTEVGFPRTFISAPDRDTPPHVNRALMPPPVALAPDWFKALSDASGGVINFERNEAGAISFTGKVCDIDARPQSKATYETYKQWMVDPSAAKDQCPTAAKREGNVISLITAGTDFTTDPRTLKDRTISVVGILRPVNLQGFNVWIVYPRGKDEIVLQ